MHPVEGSPYLRQACGHPTLFWKYAVSDALDYAIESPVWMTHEINVHLRTHANVLQLRLAIVCDHVPGSCIDEREYRGARASVRSLGDVHVRYVSIEWGEDARAFQIEPSGFDPCRLCRA